MYQRPIRPVFDQRNSLWQGLQFCYPMFGHGIKHRLYDIGKFRQHATFDGNPGEVATKFGISVPDYNGSNNNARIPRGLAKWDGRVTLHFWFTIDNFPPGDRGLFDNQWGNDNSGGFQILVQGSSGNIINYAGDLTGRQGLTVGGFATGTWYCYSFEADADNNTLTLWRNNQQVGQNTGFTKNTVDGGTTNSNHWGWFINSQLNAQVDGKGFNLMLWNRKLTVSERKFLYTRPFGMYLEGFTSPKRLGIGKAPTILSPYDAKQPIKKGKLKLNRIHPLSRQLTWCVTPGVDNIEDKVSPSLKGTLLTSGSWQSITPLGKSVESTSTSNCGAYWPFNDFISKINKDFTFVIFAELDSLVAYGHLFCIYHAAGSGWASPFGSISMQNDGTVGKGVMMSSNGTTQDWAVTTGSDFFVTGKGVHMYAARRKDNKVQFYKDGKTYETEKTLSNNVALSFSARREICIFNRQTQNVGEGTDGRCVFAGLWSRGLNDREIAQLFTNPWQLFRQNRIAFSKLPLTVITLTDSGSGNEILNVGVSFSLSDSLGSSDTLDIINQFTVADSGALAAEIVSAANSLSLTDTATSSEIIAILASIAVSESSSAHDALSILAQLSVTDTTTGTDALRVFATIALSDTGSLSNEALSVVTAIALSDTVNSSEALSLLVTMLINDTVGSSEILTILADFLLSDTGSGSETLTAGAYINVGDSGTLTSEVLSILALVALSESINATEALQILVNVAVNDAIVSSEALSVLVDLTLSDTGVTTEALSLLAQIALTDSGSSVDLVSIATTFSLSDVGVAVEFLQIIVSFAISDASTSSEAISILAQIVVTDSGLTNEALSLLVSLAVQETAFGNDALSMLVSIALSDTTVGIEVLNVLVVFGLYERGLGLFNKSDNLYNRTSGGLYNKSS